MAVLHVECTLTDLVCSWGITYNLWADQLLGTNLVPSSVYEMRECIAPTCLVRRLIVRAVIRDAVVHICP